jgi:hypothetical protein
MPAKILRNSLFILVYLAFNGCLPGKPTITKCWFYTYQTDFTAAQNHGLSPTSFLCIRTDGTYTRDFGIFDYGNWTYKDGSLSLTSKRNQTATLHIQSLTSNEMSFELYGNKLNFDGQSLPAENVSEDPFALDNNAWRIPASQKENDEAIRKRLRNHCRFWEVYFTWALKTKQESLDVRSTPTPIKIYGNGFALKSVEDEPGRWKSYFFDEDDCKKSYDILTKILEQHGIALAHTDNRYKMFIGAFQQLETALK